MRKIYFILFVLSLIIVISCNTKKQKIIYKPTQEAIDSGFVYLKGNKFYLNDSLYFPLSVNYKVEIIKNNKEMWPSPYTGYLSKLKNMDKDSSLWYLKADFQMIKDMGINSIRIVGIGEELANFDNSKIDEYLNSVQMLLDIAAQYDLKIVYLLPMLPKRPLLYAKYQPLLQKFKHNNTILAYDFFNEPLYFDSLERDRTKDEVYDITLLWKKYMIVNAPNQLLTIGLTNPRATFEWDPNVLNVDFLSFHPYEYAENMVLRDLYWCGDNIDKPWIIGETSLSADNDSVSYEKQKLFAEKILYQTINNGAVGFTWWQYKDVHWGNFFANYTGLVNRTGKHNTSDSSLTIYGTPKPTVKIFKNFKNIKQDNRIKPNNYYNVFNFKKHKVTGKVIDDDTGKPIEGAVIVGWKKGWKKSWITFTKKDGTFELMGKDKYYHYMISATKYEMIRLNPYWEELTKRDDSLSIDIGLFELEPLDFLNE